MISAINNALQGLQTASKQVEHSAERIATQSSSNNLVEDIIDIKVAETAYNANLQTIKVSDELTQELLRAFDETV